MFAPVAVIACAVLATLVFGAALAPAAQAAAPEVVEQAEVNGETTFYLSATEQTEKTATLNARVNPNGAQLSSCVFEYGTSSAYGAATLCAQSPAQIGEGSAPVAVSAAITGLRANTEYHWRITAANAGGTASSVDQTFGYPLQASGGCPDEQARQERGSLDLPNCRAYELVTPVQKNGALPEYFFSGGPPAQIAENGQRVIAASFQCYGGESQSCAPPHDSDEGQPYEYARTSAGWVTHSLAPSSAMLETDDAVAFNANLGDVLFTGPAAPEARHDAFYAREPSGALAEVGPLGESAIVDSQANQLESDTVVATANLSHVLYETEGNPTPSMWSFDGGIQGNHLYEYTQRCDDQAECEAAGQPLLVGVSGGHESRALISKCGTDFFGEAKGFLLSQDGAIVYFLAQRSEPGYGCTGGTRGNGGIELPVEELFARVDGESAAARTAAISEPQADEEGLEPPALGSRSECASTPCEEHTSLADESTAWRNALYAAASSDGSRVFFVSEQQLTDSASENEGDNLYASECVGCAELEGPHAAQEERAKRRLIDVDDPDASAPPVAGGPRVQGVIAASPDGSHVYFVAQSKLASNRSVLGREAVGGEDNLYVYAEGKVTFIGALSPLDHQAWEKAQRSNVTPDGQLLVFTSHRALTADVTHTEGPGQLYEYDADTGGLVRVSIGDDGFNDDGNDGLLGRERPDTAFTGDAEQLQLTPNNVQITVPFRSDPTMSEDGQYVFFQSPVALTPGALNDFPIGKGRFAENLYEYSDGQVYLLSEPDTTAPSKLNEEAVQIAGADASGRNVFFWTFDSLTPEDTDTQRDLYDVHVCSEAEPCTPPKPAEPPPGCGEGACQGPATAAPSPEALASQALAGAGNLAPQPGLPFAEPKPKSVALLRAERLQKALRVCRAKRSSKARTACEREARHVYGATKKPKTASKGSRRFAR